MSGKTSTDVESSPQVVASYTASVYIYYLDAYMDLATVANYNMETYVEGDLKVFAVSRAVLEGVIDDLGIEISYEDLAQKVTATFMDNTHILILTVVADDAQQAQELAEALQVRFCDYVAQVMGVLAPVALEVVTLTTQRESGASSIGIAKGAAIGAFVGFVLSIGYILVCPVLVGFGKSVHNAMKKEG